MSEDTRSEVLIVGAGVAGLAAAVALSGAGAQVRLLERKPYVGGRAYSYTHPALGETIDSQHVLLGCCTNLIDLCKLCGADEHIRWYERIPFLEPGVGGKDARMSEIGPGSLPPPAHSARGFLRAPMLSLGDKTRIAIGLAEFMRGYPAQDSEAFSEWLRRTKQTSRAIRHFWEPIVVSTLNDSFERCSTKYAAQVFYESLLKTADGGRLGIPTQPLSDFYASAAALAEKQGTDVKLRASVDALERLGDAGWRVRCSDGTVFECERLVLALPFEQTMRLLETLEERAPARAQLLPVAEHFAHAPITTVHLWFDREITKLDHAALLDTRIQWMFNKSRIRRDETRQRRDEHYVEVVISASFDELSKSREEILWPALKELQLFFPEAREAKLLRSGVLKEARATFSVTPGLDGLRPQAATASHRLYIAGDWTRTGWPSTMEGGVRSGRLAADAVVASSGGRATFLTADLPAKGLMRWLAR